MRNQQIREAIASNCEIDPRVLLTFRQLRDLATESRTKNRNAEHLAERRFKEAMEAILHKYAAVIPREHTAQSALQSGHEQRLIGMTEEMTAQNNLIYVKQTIVSPWVGL